MKNLLSVTIVCLLVGLSISCEEIEGIDDFPTLDRKYVYPLSGCDNSQNPEENCEEWIEFIGDSQVDMLIGGGDIIQRRSYRVEGEEITLFDETGLSSLSDLVFRYVNQDSLERMDNNTFWILRPNP